VCRCPVGVAAGATCDTEDQEDDDQFNLYTVGATEDCLFPGGKCSTDCLCARNQPIECSSNDECEAGVQCKENTAGDKRCASLPGGTKFPTKPVPAPNKFS